MSDNTINISRDNKNLGEYLREWAVAEPSKPAILYPSTLSYKELDKKVDNLAWGLDQMGFKKGMKVILLVKADHNFYILTFALFRLGVILVLIDPGVGRKVMKESLCNVKADAFIGMSKAHIYRLLNYKYFRKITLLVTIGPKLFWGGRNFKSLFNESEKKFEQPNVESEDIGGILFTSGSTGPPKGVIYKNHMFHAQIHYFRSHYKWSKKEIDLCTFPLIGIFSICIGSSVVIADMNPTKPASLSPEKLWKNMEEQRCTHMFGSPMVLRKIAAYALRNGKKLSHMKRIVSAGAPVPVELLRKMKSILPQGAEIHTPYGATESLPVTDITATDLIKLDENPGFKEGICIGHPLEQMNVRIIEISDHPILNWSDVNELPVNKIGEITVSGPVVTESYFNNTDANNKSKIISPPSTIIHRMGDLGRKDENGRIWFYGRKNHRVIQYDQTLFSIPIEAIFNKHPLVKRSALVGINKQENNISTAVIIIEPETRLGRKKRRKMFRDLSAITSENYKTKLIEHFLIKKKFPVDPRHNAKIFREKLSVWAEKRI